MPWEILFDKATERFLAQSHHTPIIRYLEQAERIYPLPVQLPLHILVAMSSPKSYAVLDVDREKAHLERALAGLRADGKVRLTYLPHATPRGLQRALRDNVFHVIHYIGHGGFDRATEEGILVLEDEAGNPNLADARRLGPLIHDHRSLRLMVLNACEGARNSREDPYAGVATFLVRQGVPAVVAMQFEITDEAALIFADELYNSLAKGWPVDAAVSEARKAIFVQRNEIEWGTPVLYTRAADGTLFEIAASRPEHRPKQAAPSAAKHLPSEALQQNGDEVDRLYTDGLSAFWLEKWGHAAQCFGAVLRIQPDHSDAASKLAASERQDRLRTLYEQALQAQDANEWDAACDALEAIMVVERDYRDAAKRLEDAQKNKRLAELYSAAGKLHGIENWQAVLNVFNQMDEISPRAADPHDLRATAQARLEAKQRTDSEATYRRGLRAMDAGKWESARELLASIHSDEPEYRDTGALLARLDQLAANDGPSVRDTSTRIDAKYRIGADPIEHENVFFGMSAEHSKKATTESTSNQPEQPTVVDSGGVWVALVLGGSFLFGVFYIIIYIVRWIL